MSSSRTLVLCRAPQMTLKPKIGQSKLHTCLPAGPLCSLVAALWGASPNCRPRGAIRRAHKAANCIYNKQWTVHCSGRGCTALHCSAVLEARCALLACARWAPSPARQRPALLATLGAPSATSVCRCPRVTGAQVEAGQLNWKRDETSARCHLVAGEPR